MSNSGKIILGILSILPLILACGYFFFFFNVFLTGIHETMHTEGPPTFMLAHFGTMAILIGLTIISSLGLMIYYIIHAMNNPRLDSTERLIWVIVFVFAHSIGYIIYWYMKIWKAPDEAYSS